MALRTPDFRSMDVTGPLTRESFTPQPYRRRIVGAFGEQEGGADPGIRYNLPQFDQAALGAMDEGGLASLLNQAKAGRKALEQSWRTVLPAGYTGIYDDHNELQGPDPRSIPENLQRAQALSAIGRGAAAVGNEISRRRQMELKAQNQLLGGIAAQGYTFAPGALNDAGVRNEIWDNRNSLPGFLKQQAAQRSYMRGPNDHNPDGYSWLPQSAISMPTVLNPRPSDYELDRSWRDRSDEPLPAVINSGPSFGRRFNPRPSDYELHPSWRERGVEPMPFPIDSGPSFGTGFNPRPSDYELLPSGSRSDFVDRGDEPGFGDIKPRPSGDRFDFMDRNPRPPSFDPSGDGMSPPAYPDIDRILRPAGDTPYNQLRPGFYSGGGVTGPPEPVFDQYTPQRPVFDTQGPSRVGPRPDRTLSGAGGMTLRPGVTVRNPFETSVETTRRRTPFA